MSSTAAKVAIMLNGEPIVLSSAPLIDALCELGYDPEQQGIAVALNMAVVPRSEWPETSIGDGDRIDIVGAKQGG